MDKDASVQAMGNPMGYPMGNSAHYLQQMQMMPPPMQTSDPMSQMMRGMQGHGGMRDPRGNPGGFPGGFNGMAGSFPGPMGAGMLPPHAAPPPLTEFRSAADLRAACFHVDGSKQVQARLQMDMSHLQSGGQGERMFLLASLLDTSMSVEQACRDSYANHAVQALIWASVHANATDELHDIAGRLLPHFKNLSAHSSGCRVAQALLAALETAGVPCRSTLLSVAKSLLNPSLHTLSMDPSGNHVVQAVISLCGAELGSIIHWLAGLEEAQRSNTQRLNDGFHALAVHQHGSRVLECALRRLCPEDTSVISSYIADSATLLATHHWGNHVLGSLFKEGHERDSAHQIRAATAITSDDLKLFLSMLYDKGGAFVLEKLARHGNRIAAALAVEAFAQLSPSAMFESACHPTGNYAVQNIIAHASPQRQAFFRLTLGQLLDQNTQGAGRYVLNVLTATSQGPNAAMLVCKSSDAKDAAGRRKGRGKGGKGGGRGQGGFPGMGAPFSGGPMGPMGAMGGPHMSGPMGGPPMGGLGPMGGMGGHPLMGPGGMGGGAPMGMGGMGMGGPMGNPAAMGMMMGGHGGGGGGGGGKGMGR